MITFSPFQWDDKPDCAVIHDRQTLAVTARADDGAVVGCGGFVWLTTEHVFAFLDVYNEAYRQPVTLVRMAFAMMGSARSLGLARVYTLADISRHERTEAWLARLKFKALAPFEYDATLEHARQTSNMEVFRWQR